MPPAFRGKRESELGSHARPSPGCQPATVQIRVLHRDRQSQSGSADRPSARRIAPPEAVEDLLGLNGFETDAVVSHRHGDGGVVAFHEDVDRAALTMFDRIDQQVAEDALDPTSRPPQPCTVACRGSGSACRSFPRTSRASTTRRTRSRRSTSVDSTAHSCVEARDLQQVGEQRFEPV